MAEGLAAGGCEVEVIVPFPNRLIGVPYNGYPRCFWYRGVLVSQRRLNSHSLVAKWPTGLNLEVASRVMVVAEIETWVGVERI